MGDRTLLEGAKAFGLRKLLSYLDSNPEENIGKIMDWVERLDSQDIVRGKLDQVRQVLEDEDNIWFNYIEGLYRDIDGDLRKRLFENFIINANILGGQRARKVREEEDCNVPWAILMDPTSACNLNCLGCWAADYGDKLSMSLETLDDIIGQGKELGTYMYIFSGGEPLIRKDDIISLCEKHSDCAFLAFTNASLIDEDFANEMLRVKNFVPAISVEGFEEATDFRRGKGTYQSVVEAMELLREKKLAFGISCCYTSKNTDEIGSEAYFDRMIELGAKFAWFFTYMPVGVNAEPDLMVDPDQREFMYRQIRKFRRTKPIFTIDFWNDGEYVKGCIAGGRNYLHINANGDIEPCAFIHYSDSNIRDKTLLEAYKSPLFMEYRANQPFNQNHLRPCPLLDNKDRLAQMVDRSGAQSTDMESPEDVHELCGKCHGVADSWALRAGELWQEREMEREAKLK